MRRKGMGKGMGQGYKNLVSIYDSNIHSLSAKGVKSCMPSMKNLTLKGMGYMKSFDMHDGYVINCWAEDTRSGFRHIAVLMKNGSEVGRTKATYLNRTWERYTYQSVINKLLQKEFPEAEAQTRMKVIDDGKAGTLYAKGKKKSGGFYDTGGRNWIGFPKVKTNDGSKLRVAYYLAEDDLRNKIKGGKLIISFSPEGSKGMYSYFVDTLMEDYKDFLNGQNLCVYGGTGQSVTNMGEIIDFTIKNREDIETALRGFNLDEKPPMILRAKGKK